MAQRTRPSVLREARVADEFARLVRSPLFHGRDVPRGDGRIVLVLPGLFGNDFYLEPMHRWLRRIGYTPVRSSLIVNAGCPQRLTEEVESHVTIQRATRGGPLAIIGHSRGGILARALAGKLQAGVSHLILLGSPAAAVSRAMEYRTEAAQVPAGQRVYHASQRARQILDPDCDAPDCGCPFLADVRSPLHVTTRVTSIYSAEDPIVPRSACRMPGAMNHEITGTHSGLAYNVEALALVAQALAER
jgi:pimeloyl-ACP methyl ester carboxylesterase